MLRDSLHGNNVAPSDPTPGFAASGLPDDFPAFLGDVLADEPAITEADIDAMWADEQARRDAADAGLWVGFDIGSLLADAIDEAFAALAIATTPAAA